jgi:hypothetical protein
MAHGSGSAPRLERARSPWYRQCVAMNSAGPELSPRLRRTLELVYGVEGVLEARIWQWPGRVAVGVRGGNGTSPTDLVRRVEVAVAGIREPEEAWEFGILGDSAG